MTLRYRSFWMTILVAFCLLLTHQAGVAGDYLDSAHGSADDGVLRESTAAAGYARGNCIHCHIQHANQVPYPYALQGENFNPNLRTGPYDENSNFCFSCHSQHASVQKVTNSDYSRSSGCSTVPGTVGVLETFNQRSNHNLYDIWNFMSTDTEKFKWFTDSSNPCSGCHNAHNARSRKNKSKEVVFSAVSKPTDPDTLWTQSMGNRYELQYEPPYCSSSSNREPVAELSAQEGRDNTVNYVSFCMDCHDKNNTIYSSTLERDLVKIDWTATGDIHGANIIEGSLAVKPPYLQSGKLNYVLSCLDCHDPHGSDNITLLRRRVNGSELTGSIETAMPSTLGTGENNSNSEMGYICMGCHEQDAGTGDSTINPPAWENIHHDLPGSPYLKTMCSNCHPAALDELSESQEAIACDKCHFHGATDSWLSAGGTGQLTF